MSEMIPQAFGQPQPAASNGIDLPPVSQPGAQPAAQGVDLPPISKPTEGTDLPPDDSFLHQQQQYVDRRWYEQAGKAFGSPNTQLYDKAEIAKRQGDAEKFFNDPNNGYATWSANGGAGLFGGVSREFGKKDDQGKGEKNIVYVKNGIMSNEVTPEGWGAYVKTTLPPEIQKKYDSQFEQEFKLSKALETRRNLVMDRFKQAGGTTEVQKAEPSPEQTSQDLRAVAAADEAAVEAGFPPLSSAEKGQLINLKNGAFGAERSRDYFTDLTSDTAGTLARGGFSTAASPGETLLAIGSKIEDKVAGPRKLGESNWFSRRLEESQATQENYAKNYTPELSGREDFVNRSSRAVAEAAPALFEMLATEGASGPKVLTRLAAMTMGGAQSAEQARKEIVKYAKDHGMSDSDAETAGIQGLAIIGPVATALNYLPLHQIIDKNPEIRPLVIRMLSSAGVNGAAGTAQNIVDQLVKGGIVGKDFSVEELKKAIESGLVVGTAQGLLPVGGGKGAAEESESAKPAAPVEPTVNEFKPSFLEDEAAAPAKQPESSDAEAQRGIIDALREQRQALEKQRLSQEEEHAARVQSIVDAENFKPGGNGTIEEGQPVPEDTKTDLIAPTEDEYNAFQQRRQGEDSGRQDRLNALVEAQKKEGTLTTLSDDAEKNSALSLMRDALDKNTPLEGGKKTTISEVAPSTPEQKAAVLIAEKLGHKVALFETNNPTMSGANGSENPKVIVINAKGNRPVLQVLGHELTHSIRKVSPETYNRLLSEIEGLDPQAIQKGMQSYHLNAPEIIRKRLKANPDYWKEEGTANVMMEAFAKREFWDRLSKRDPSLFEKVAGTVVKFVKNMEALWKGQKGLVAKPEVLSKIADVLSDYANKVPQVESFEGRGKRIADAYEGLKHEPNNPEVQKSYAAFKREVRQQFDDLAKGGLKMEPWTKEGQPYKNSKEMTDDVKNNKHLYFFTGGELPADHPMAEKTDLGHTYNDIFRAIHDVYGHANTGQQFGPRGEEGAYQAHSKMFSDEARPAMATETRGQNSFVNYGPNGEFNRANPGKTIYAPQKAAILPKEFHSQDKFLPEEKPTKELPTLENIRYEAKAPSISEKVKGVINAAKDSPVGFKMTLLDKLRKGVKDDVWAASKAYEIARQREAGRQILPSEDYAVLSAVIRGGGEAHAEQRDTGMRDATNKLIHDGPTKSPITTDWKLAPVVDVAQAHFGDKTGNSIDKAQRVIVDTLVAQATVERGGNEVNRQTVSAMRDKIKSLLSSLPGGEKLIHRMMVENKPLEMEKTTSPEQALRQEIKSVKSMVASAKQSLSDMLAMNRKSPSDKVRPEPGKADLNEQLAKARKQLEILNEFMNKTGAEGHASEKDLKFHDLNDVFTEKEYNKVLSDIESAEIRAKATGATVDPGDFFVKAADRKIDRILESLPPDTLPKYRKLTPAEAAARKDAANEHKTEEEIQDEEDQAKLSAEEKAKRAELKRINSAKRDIRQRLADSISMVKAAEHGPVNGPPIKGEPASLESRIEKANASLSKLDTILESVQSGKPVEPGEFFTDKELAKLRNQALDKPLSGISKEGSLNATGHLDIKKAEEFLANVKDSPAWEHIQEGTRRYRVWGDVVLQKLVDQGFISKDLAKAARKNNQFYANMQRVMDETGMGSVYEGTAGIHKFRGSNRLIDNPYVNQDVTTDRVLKASQENLARRSWVDLAGKYPDIASKQEKAGPDTIEVKRDGVTEHWKVDPEIKEAMETMTKYHPEFLGGVLNAFGRMKRWGVTKTPSFIFRNFTRDFQDRLFKGDSGLGDIMHALDKEMISEMTATGGSVQRTRAGSARTDYHRELSKRLNELASDKSVLTALPSKIWEGYSSLNDTSENANRVAEYNAAKAEAKRRGWSDYDATLYASSKSRGLIDFAQAGSVIRQINRVAYMAFLNGRLQGAFGDIKAAKNSPGKTILKGFLMGTVPAVAAYAMAAAQGKEEEYAALPVWRRMMFSNFYVGMGPVKWVSVPKVPLAALFAAPVEFGVEKHAGRKDALQKIALQGVNIMSPVDDPSVLPASFLLENLTNYSFYYNRSIIPDWERSLPIERRNTEGSSNFGKIISQITKSAGWQVDPRYIDNAITRQFGGTGQLITSTSNLGSGKPMDTIGAYLSRATGFTAETPGASTPDIANVYERATTYYDEGSPEIKQIAAFLKEGYTAPSRQEQDVAFAKARELARKVREQYDENGDRFKAIGKFNAAVNHVQSEYKSQDTFDKRVAWLKDNPQEAQVLRVGENFDKVYSRLQELRKLRLKSELPPATKKMADDQVERVYSILTNMMAKVQ